MARTCFAKTTSENKELHSKKKSLAVAKPKVETILLIDTLFGEEEEQKMMSRESHSPKKNRLATDLKTRGTGKASVCDTPR